MLQTFKNGQGSIVLRVKLLDSTVATGAGKTGLSSSSAGLIISTIADNEATPTIYAQASSNVETISTLGTFAAPTASKCRFKEVDATNHKGIYEVQIADARFAVSSAKSLLVSISGVTGAAEADFVIQLQLNDPFIAQPANFTTLSIDGSGRVDVAKVAGTAQTARDIGLSVLLSSGAGTGQLDFTSGVVKANATQWLGGTIPAVNVTGVPLIDLKYVLGTISPAAAGSVRADAVTGAVGSVTGAVGSVTGNVGGNVVGSVGSVTGSVGSVVGDTPQTGDSFARIGVAGAGLTALGDTRIANLDATISSRTKPADTQAAVTTVTNLTNAPAAGDLTSTMKTSVQTAADAAVTANSLVNAIAGYIDTEVAAIKTQTDKLAFTITNQVDVNVVDWKGATAPAMTGDAFALIGTAGAGLTAIGDARIANLDAAVSSRSTYAGGAVASVTGAVGSVTGSVGSVVGAVGSVTGLTASDVGAIKAKTDNLPSDPADASDVAGLIGAVAGDVWEELTASHVGVGTMGAAMAAAGGSGDPWATALPGAYGAGTAGQIVGDFIDGAISAVPTATDNADALLNRDMSAVSDTNARSPLNALRFLRNKWSLAGTALTVTKENDATSAWTATVSTSPGADPISGNDPA